jgi:hypothetical protein
MSESTQRKMVSESRFHGNNRIRRIGRWQRLEIAGMRSLRIEQQADVSLVRRALVSVDYSFRNYPFLA